MPTVAYASGKFVKVDTDGKWEDVPFDDLPSPMHHEWKGFVEAIQQDLEPPACGVWGCHTMEILLAAEEPLIASREVMLASGPGGFNKTSGTPVTIKHGWF